jgi:hypothetical protein
MYGTLLGVFKLLSDGLTALSGMYGLMSDFRDDKTRKLTRSGKRAMVGIALGFLLSGAISVLEYEKSIAEERAHSLEVKRLANPLGQIKVEMWWGFNNNDPSISGFERQLEGYAAQKFGLFDGQVAADVLPPELRASVPEILDDTAGADFAVFKRNSGVCPTGNPYPKTIDLFLIQEDPVELKDDMHSLIGVHRDKRIYIDRTFPLKFDQSTGEIASDEDFLGASLIIAIHSSDYWPENFVLTTTRGRNFAPKPKSEKVWHAARLSLSTVTF